MTAFQRAAPAVHLGKFMKTWYVVAGRTPPDERGHFNATETYAWDEAAQRIELRYEARRGSFHGPETSRRRIGSFVDPHARSRWRIRARFSPIVSERLILAVAIDYSWAAVGVPSGQWLWILGDTPLMDEITLAAALSEAKSLGYPVDGVERKPQEVREDRPWGWIPPAEYRDGPGAGRHPIDA